MVLISKDLTTVRVVSTILIFFLGGLSSSIPILSGFISKKFPRFMYYMGLFNHAMMSLGTGVILSTAFMHIMPEGIEKVNEGWPTSGTDEEPYPYGFLFVQIGLVVVFVIECELHRLVDAAKGATMKVHLIEGGIAVHSVLVGVALGTMDIDTAAVLGIALMFHQLCEGFAVGALIQKGAQSVRHAIILIVVFAISTPIGICIGILASHYGDPNSKSAVLAQGILATLAGGLLLYAGTVEFLNSLLSASTLNCIEARDLNGMHDNEIDCIEIKTHSIHKSFPEGITCSEEANEVTDYCHDVTGHSNFRVSDTSIDYLCEHPQIGRFIMYFMLAAGIIVMSVIAMWA